MQGEGGIASLQGLFFPSAQELRDRPCQDERAEPPACAHTKQQQNQQSRARRGRGKAKGKRRGGKSLQCGDAEGAGETEGGESPLPWMPGAERGGGAGSRRVCVPAPPQGHATAKRGSPTTRRAARPASARPARKAPQSLADAQRTTRPSSALARRGAAYSLRARTPAGLPGVMGSGGQYGGTGHATPGPGAYGLVDSRSTDPERKLGFSFGRRALSSTKSTPGPGAYSGAATVRTLSGTAAKAAATRKVVGTFGGGDRFGGSGRKLNAFYNVAPGPGEYVRPLPPQDGKSVARARQTAQRAARRAARDVPPSSMSQLKALLLAKDCMAAPSSLWQQPPAGSKGSSRVRRRHKT